MENSVKRPILDDDKVKVLKPWCIFGLEIYFKIAKKLDQVVIEYPKAYSEDGFEIKRFPCTRWKGPFKWINQHHP